MKSFQKYEIRLGVKLGSRTGAGETLFDGTEAGVKAGALVQIFIWSKIVIIMYVIFLKCSYQNIYIYSCGS